MITLAMVLAAQATAADRLRAALDAAERSASITYAFTAKVRPSGGDALSYDGRGVALSGGRLQTQIKLSPGRGDQRIRVGPEGVELHNEFAGWEKSTDPSLGRGFENPWVVLAEMRRRIEGVADDGKGTLALRLEGAAAVETLAALKIQEEGLVAEGTWVELTARLAAGRLDRVGCRARARLADRPDLPAHVDAEVGVTVEAYDRDKELTWR